MHEQQEKDLIEGIRLNDGGMVKRFIACYYDRILHLMHRKIGRGNADCKDLANEILWEAIVKIRDGSFKEEKGRIAPYLYGIANNCCKNYFKAQKKIPQVAFSKLAPSGSENKLDFLERDISLAAYQQQLQERRDEEIRDILEQAIRALDEKYKKLIYLKYYQQLSYEEISQKENLPIPKVKSRLFEARRKLEQIVLKKLPRLSNFSL